jgi:hypothetical protein
MIVSVFDIAPLVVLEQKDSPHGRDSSAQSDPHLTATAQ